MPFIPKFRLYNSVGDTLLLTFPVVQETNAPQSPSNIVEITGTRGIGSIIIAGGTPPWNLIIKGVLIGDNYQAIVVAMDALESTVTLNTAFLVRIDKTISSYYEYNVKRILPIEYPENLRTSNQKYTVTLRVNSWG
ncbi:hypothetical protein LCGC14_1926240 [marine sediment metagenome]|uniref:Uncharacterized protein n=1 Tax=marine sediment metagenome TaxID=412755 RepID=A0A0F9I354_9ZZZZ